MTLFTMLLWYHPTMVPVVPFAILYFTEVFSRFMMGRPLAKGICIGRKFVLDVSPRLAISVAKTLFGGIMITSVLTA